MSPSSACQVHRGSMPLTEDQLERASSYYAMYRSCFKSQWPLNIPSSWVSLGCISTTPKSLGDAGKSLNGLITATNTVSSYHSSAQYAHQWRAWNSLYPYPFPLSTKTFSKTSSAKPMVYPRTIPMIVILNYFQKECLPVTGYTPFPSMNKKLQSNIYKKHCNRGTFTRPCLLLLLGSFLWIKKGGLQPRIDYRGLNQITVKYHCPLPLGPAALE